MPGLLGTSLNADDILETLRGIGRGLNFGGTSGMIGAPVDMATAVLNNPGLLHPGLLGVQGLGIKDPVGGSKWIEQKLQGQGLLPKRQGNWQEGVGELASTFINPMTAAAVAGPKLYAIESQMMDNAMAPREVRGLLGSQGGMLRLPQGRIPENGSDTEKLAKALQGRAEAAGYSVSVDKSTRSPSRYVNIDKYPNGDAGLQPEVSAQIRFSNHQDYHPGMAGGVERFSVDPASLNSYEDALQWLSSQGLPVAKRATSKPRVSFAGFTAEDKAVSQYMNKYFGSTEGMTVDQLRQVYGDNNVNAVIKKLKG